MWYSKILIYTIPTPITTGNFLFSGINISPFCVRRSLSSTCMHLSFSHMDYFHRHCAPVYISEPGNNCYIKMKCRKFTKVILNLYIFRCHVIPITFLLNFTEDYSDFVIPHIINYVPSISDYTNGMFHIYF